MSTTPSAEEEVYGEFENPPRIRTFYIIAVADVVLILMCVYGIGISIDLMNSGESGDIDSFILIASFLFGIGAFAALLPYHWKRYVSRCPKSVSVQKGGFLMEFKSLGPISVPWEDLKGVYQTPAGKYTLGRGQGAVVLPKGTPTVVSREIADSIREAYRKENGRYPAVWNGAPESLRKLRKAPKGGN